MIFKVGAIIVAACSATVVIGGTAVSVKMRLTARRLIRRTRREAAQAQAACSPQVAPDV